MSDDLLLTRTAAGQPVAEGELAPEDIGLLPRLIRNASSRGAALLWIHSNADLSDAGFTARQGYRRLTADAVPLSEPLPLLDLPAVHDIMRRAYLGQWGHHEFEGHGLPPGAKYAGLGRTALCRFEPEHRCIDGPAFADGAASPQAVQRLVLGAAAYLGPGVITVDTWGEPAEPYMNLGFRVVEECGGWELTLARLP